MKGGSNVKMQRLPGLFKEIGGRSFFDLPLKLSSAL